VLRDKGTIQRWDYNLLAMLRKQKKSKPQLKKTEMKETVEKKKLVASRPEITTMQTGNFDRKVTGHSNQLVVLCGIAHWRW